VRGLAEARRVVRERRLGVGLAERLRHARVHVLEPRTDVRGAGWPPSGQLGRIREIARELRIAERFARLRRARAREIDAVLERERARRLGVGDPYFDRAELEARLAQAAQEAKVPRKVLVQRGGGEA